MNQAKLINPFTPKIKFKYIAFEKMVSEVVRIGSTIIFHLSKMCSAGAGIGQGV